MSALYTMKGVEDLLDVFEDRLTLTPKGFLNKGIKGAKEIPFQSIVTVEFKEAGAWSSGYIRFTIPGTHESRDERLAGVQDRNTFMFAQKKNNPLAIAITTYITSAVRKVRTPQVNSPTASLSDELQKLAGLKERGILSDEEFQAAKTRLIR